MSCLSPEWSQGWHHGRVGLEPRMHIRVTRRAERYFVVGDVRPAMVNLNNVVGDSPPRARSP